MSHQPTPDDTNSPPVDLLLKALPAHVPAGHGGVARLRLVLVPAQPSAELLRHAVAHLAPVLPLLTDLGDRFAAEGHSLALVGGPVRDAFLGRTSPAAATPSSRSRPIAPMPMTG